MKFFIKLIIVSQLLTVCSLVNFCNDTRDTRPRLEVPDSPTLGQTAEFPATGNRLLLVGRVAPYSGGIPQPLQESGGMFILHLEDNRLTQWLPDETQAVDTVEALQRPRLSFDEWVEQDFDPQESGRRIWLDHQGRYFIDPDGATFERGNMPLPLHIGYTRRYGQAPSPNEQWMAQLGRESLVITSQTTRTITLPHRVESSGFMWSPNSERLLFKTTNLATCYRQRNWAYDFAGVLPEYRTICLDDLLYYGSISPRPDITPLSLSHSISKAWPLLWIDEQGQMDKNIFQYEVR